MQVSIQWMMGQKLLPSRWEPWRWVHSGGHQKLTATNLAIINTRLIPNTGKAAKVLINDKYLAFEVIWTDKRVFIGCLKIKLKKKIAIFYYDPPLFWATANQTVSWLDCDIWWKEDSAGQQQLTSSVVGWEAPKDFLTKSILCDGLLPVWSSTAFWISVQPLYLRSGLSKSMRCIRNWYLLSALVNWTHFTSMAYPITSLQRLAHWASNFSSHTPYSPDSSPTLTTVSLYFNSVLRGKYIHNLQNAEDTFQKCVEGENMHSMLK